MKIEVSSGGLVFRKKGGKAEVLLLKDHNNQWTFPKGLVENGEDMVETAKREIAEEVGLENIRFVGKIDTIGYFYRFRRQLIKKTVYYFLFEFIGKEKPKPQIEEGVSQVKWFSFNKALAIIGYRKTNEIVLKKALYLTRRVDV